MFKLIKFILWVCLTIVMAYFLSDIKIGGKTLKQNIDDFLHSPKGEEIKKEIQSYTEKKIQSTIEKVIKEENKEEAKDEKVNQDKAKTEEEPKSDMTKDEKNEVEKIIKKNK